MRKLSNLRQGWPNRFDRYISIPLATCFAALFFATVTVALKFRAWRQR